jgi:disulfide bond formation protein DsbB
VTHGVIVALAVLAVLGQVALAATAALVIVALPGFAAPLGVARRVLWGYELWVAFLVAAIATGGSLFLSDIAHFVPCELCWFQRICMYPLSITLLIAAVRNDARIGLTLLPLPLVGAGISVYHLLVENRVVDQTTACQISAPGGCATKWIDEFGYVTIPTLALTAFLLVVVLLVMALGPFDPEAREEPPG